MNKAYRDPALEEQEQRVLGNSSLFTGMSEEKMAEAFQLLQARVEEFTRGSIINRPGEPLRRFGIVLTGSVQVICVDIQGNDVIMAEAGPGRMFGEAHCYLETGADIIIQAAEHSRILTCSLELVRNPSADRFARELAGRFTACLAERTLSLNDRIQVLSRSPLRERILMLFTQYEGRYGSSFELPFSRKDLAVYLGANRSAVSRELSHMIKDGIVEVQGRRCMILREKKE